MKVVRITRPGGPEVLVLDQAPEPVPQRSELLIEVHAAGLNRADLLQCQGRYPAPPGAVPDVPGLEYSGSVLEVGSEVQSFRPGDKVMGIVASGAFAERLTVHEREAIPVPSGLDLVESAAVPEAFMTAWDALVLQAKLCSGEQVLIHAATSGVGTAAIQIVSAAGATSIGTGRTAEKLERCRAMGLSHALTVNGPSFALEVNARTQGRGVDVTLDLVGGQYLPETLDSCAPRARVVLVGLLSGNRAELNLSTALTKRLSIFGTVLRSRPLEEKIALAQSFRRHVLPLFQSGRCRPVVDTIFPMSDIQKAFLRMAQSQNFGKIVLRWP